jgi:hypothetical protein
MDLNISAVDDNTLAPFVAHNPRHLFGTVLADQRADEVQGAVDTGQHTRRSEHAQAAETQVCALEHALAASVADLQADGALAGCTSTAASIGTLFNRASRGRPAAALRHAALLAVLLLGQQVRVLVLVLAKIETQVVDNVASVHNVRTIRHVALRSIAADDLELGHEIRVGGGG